MFGDKKSLVDASIEIDQEANIILNYYTDYLRLTRMGGLVSINKDLKDDSSFLSSPLQTSKERRLK
jgi:hypothetical protein